MAFEQPEQSYFPSAKVRLIVRLEEFQQASDLRKTIPKEPTQNIKGTKSERGELKFQQNVDPNSGNTGFEINSELENFAATEFGETEGDEFTFEIAGLIPIQATWTENGFRTANTLSFSLAWQDFPIDPRMIRALGVEFFIGTVTQQDYAAGVLGKERTTQTERGSLLKEPFNRVPDSFRDSENVLFSNRHFRGFATSIESTFDENQPMLQFEAQDLTLLFLNQQQPSKMVLASDLPIDEAVALFLSNFPLFSGIRVEYRPNFAERPVLKNIFYRGSFSPALGPPSAKGGGGVSKLSVWDYLQDVIASIGHMLHLDDLTLVIEPIQTVVNGSVQIRSTDLYKEKTFSTGTYSSRTFIYGVNLLKLRFKHQFVRNQASNIEVRCYNPLRKKTLVARFPEPKDRVVLALPASKKTDGNWKEFRVQGISDKATLKRIAEGIYNEIGRNELLVELETKNLASYGGSNEEPDLFFMKPGDAFFVQVNRDVEQDVGTIENQLSVFERCYRFLISLGFADDFARQYAALYQNRGFQKIFRLKERIVNWNINQEVSIRLVGANFLEVRLEKVTNETNDNLPINTGKDPIGGN